MLSVENNLQGEILAIVWASEKLVCICWVKSLFGVQVISTIPKALPCGTWRCQISCWALRLLEMKTAGRRALLAKEGEQTDPWQFSDSGKSKAHPDLCLRWQKKCVGSMEGGIHQLWGKTGTGEFPAIPLYWPQSYSVSAFPLVQEWRTYSLFLLSNSCWWIKPACSS